MPCTELDALTIDDTIIPYEDLFWCLMGQSVPNYGCDASVYHVKRRKKKEE